MELAANTDTPSSTCTPAQFQLSLSGTYFNQGFYVGQQVVW